MIIGFAYTQIFISFSKIIIIIVVVVVVVATVCDVTVVRSVTSC